MRHNKLLSPFDDYNRLNFQDLIHLSNQSISPKISTYYEPNDVTRKLSQTKIDLVYTSNISRTKDTAQMLGFDTVTEIEELNEIIFDITKLINHQEYENSGLAIVREKLWKHLFFGIDGVEDLAILDRRLEKIIGIIRNHSEKNILFISHGFLIILMYIKIIKNRSLSKISYEEFLSFNISPVGYLSGYYIDSLE